MNSFTQVLREKGKVTSKAGKGFVIIWPSKTMSTGGVGKREREERRKEERRG